MKKLKPITECIVVFFPSEDDEAEFREILHGNGYCWMGGDSLLDYSLWGENHVYVIHPDKHVAWTTVFATEYNYDYRAFKEHYVE